MFIGILDKGMPKEGFPCLGNMKELRLRKYYKERSQMKTME
jgi:hypothetical protein